jgi:5-oxoprolinase (ATP-hydrolysing) subunit A
MNSVDLNCDMGEAFGPWPMGNDRELMPLISSTNIACGFHAGDPTTMRRTVELALEYNVSIGAHPGYPDLQGFGRRNMAMKPEEVYDLIQYQVSALKGICESRGGKLHHVKPHGALYNQAAKDRDLASAIAAAVKAIDRKLVLYGLSGSCLVSEGQAIGLRTASEAFADRTYQNDGSLTPRTQPNALITETAEAVKQAVAMVCKGSISANDGTKVTIQTDTICIHGDSANAVEFARAINEVLTVQGIEISAPFLSDAK